MAFRKQIERSYRHVLDDDGEPVELHLVMDNYAAHKHAKVHEWLEQQGPCLRRRLERPLPPFVWTKTAEEILKKTNRPTTSSPRH